MNESTEILAEGTAEVDQGELLQMLQKETDKTRQLESKITNFENAMHIINKRTLQLEANIAVLRQQRDALLEKETDALVNLEMERVDTQQTIKSLQTELQSTRDSITPAQAKIYQSQLALDEVRQKFAQVKSDQKKAQQETKLAERENENLRKAINWFLAESSEIKTNIAKRFYSATKEHLTTAHIETAYRSLDAYSGDIREDFLNYLLETNQY